jgi:hypothetical protein
MAVELEWSAIGSLRVLSVRAAAGAGDPFAEWVGDGLARVLAELRAVFADGASARVALVAEPAPGGDPHAGAAAEALVEGLRGIAGALTRELRDRARVNVIVARPGSEDAVAPALEYLAGEGGGFVAGATLRLT